MWQITIDFDQMAVEKSMIGETKILTNATLHETEIEVIGNE